MSRKPLFSLKDIIGADQRMMWLVHGAAFLGGLVLTVVSVVYPVALWVMPVFLLGLLVAHVHLAFRQEQALRRPLVALIPLVLAIVFVRMLLSLILFSLTFGFVA